MHTTTIIAYAKDGALYCPDCAGDRSAPVMWCESEADAPQHCEACQAFLYNQLTDAGRAKVAKHIESWIENELTNTSGVIANWCDYYGARITVTID